MCVLGSESFADYRKQLLPWEECLQRLPAYCEKVGLPGTAKEFVASLKNQLEETAQQLDDKFPSCRVDVSINEAGEPELGRVPEIGSAHVFTPVTNAHLVCRLLLEKKQKNHHNNHTH